MPFAIDAGTRCNGDNDSAIGTGTDLGVDAHDGTREDAGTKIRIGYGCWRVLCGVMWAFSTDIDSEIDFCILSVGNGPNGILR